MKFKCTGFIIIVVTIIFFSSNLFSQVHFDALNGTDLGMGTGARAIGLGGAFTALADDVSASYWNPAGLATLKASEISFSFYFPKAFSEASIVFKPAFSLFKTVNVAIGISLVNRLRLKGDSGSEDTWDGYPSQILDLSMIEVGEGFSGALDSDTRDKRLSVAFDTPFFENLSFGFNLVSIE